VVEKRLTVEKILRLCKYKGDLPLIEENTIGGLFRVAARESSYLRRQTKIPSRKRTGFLIIIYYLFTFTYKAPGVLKVIGKGCNSFAEFLYICCYFC
jgi:hypothetical protein